MTRRAIVRSGLVQNVVLGGSEGVSVPDGTPVGPGWSYDGSTFTAPSTPSRTAPVVNEITRTQLGLWLNDNGFAGGLDNATVQAVLAAASTTAQIKAGADVFSRSDSDLIALTAALATAAGVSIDFDAAFSAAADL